jgi:hypothetical protein
LHPLHLTTVERTRGLLPGEEEDTEEAATLREFNAKSLARDILSSARQLTRPEPELQPVVSNILAKIEFKWTFAGTKLVPRKSWSGRRWRKLLRHYTRTFHRSTHRWIQILLLRGDEWGKDLDLLRLEVRAQKLIEEYSGSIPKRIESGTIPEFQRLHNQLSNAREMLESLDDYDSIRAYLNRDAKSLLKSLRSDELTSVADTLLDTKLEAVPDETLRTVKSAVDSVTKIRHLLSKLETGKPVPRYRFVELPIADTISLDIYARLKRGLFRFTQLTTGSLSEMSSRISDIENVIKFSHETSSNLLGRRRDSGDVEKAKQELDNGYKRALSQTRDMKKELRKLGRTTVEAVNSRLRNFQLGVRELIDNDRAMSIQARVMKANARVGLAHVWKSTAESFANSGRWLGSSVITVGGWIRGAVTDIRRLSGLEVPTSAVDPRLLRLLSEAREHMDMLPLVYQRIFRLHPLTDERFFISRQEELAELDRQSQLWKHGHIASTAIIGERGSGRTSLLKIAIHRSFTDVNVRWIDLDQTIEDSRDFAKHLTKALRLGKAISLDAIERKLLAGDKTVIVFEDLHNLFLRTIDGFEALERFLLLMSRTSSKVFWILTCTKYSWSYLDKVAGVSGHLQWTIDLTDFSTEEVTAALMKRSRASGFKVQVLPSSKVKRSRSYRKLRNDEERQRYLFNHYFQQLSRFAAGNITVAILFWLHSIRGNEGGVLQLSPDITFDPSFIRTFHPDDLFTLQAFAIHEFLDDEQHARVFHQKVDASRRQLSRLRNLGILEESTGGYRIHPFLFRPVVEVLKERNMLP